MKQTLIIFGILLAAIFGIWYYQGALFGDKVVNEEPIVNIAERPTEDLSSVQKVQEQPDIAEAPVEDPVPFVTTETEPVRVVDTRPIPTPTTDPFTTPVSPPQPTPVLTPSPEPAPQPTLIQGSLNGSGSYDVSGSVFISGSDLSLVNFDSTRVPDGRVYLANSLNAADFVDLGALKGNRGDQNYSIPAGVDAADYEYVLIWCRAFSVLIGSARI